MLSSARMPMTVRSQAGVMPRRRSAATATSPATTPAAPSKLPPCGTLVQVRADDDVLSPPGRARAASCRGWRPRRRTILRPSACAAAATVAWARCSPAPYGSRVTPGSSSPSRRSASNRAAARSRSAATASAIREASIGRSFARSWRRVSSGGGGRKRRQKFLSCFLACPASAAHASCIACPGPPDQCLSAAHAAHASHVTDEHRPDVPRPYRALSPDTA